MKCLNAIAPEEEFATNYIVSAQRVRAAGVPPVAPKGQVQA